MFRRLESDWSISDGSGSLRGLKRPLAWRPAPASGLRKARSAVAVQSSRRNVLAARRRSPFGAACIECTCDFWQMSVFFAMLLVLPRFDDKSFCGGLKFADDCSKASAAQVHLQSMLLSHAVVRPQARRSRQRSCLFGLFRRRHRRASPRAPPCSGQSRSQP
jgi:hypothetical protein